MQLNVHRFLRVYLVLWNLTFIGQNFHVPTGGINVTKE